MSYKFKLQKLLDFREKLEEKSKLSFMDAIMEKNKTEEELGVLRENYNKYKVIPNGTSTVNKKIIQNYLNLINTSIETKKDVLETKKEILEEKRVELIKAQVDKKTVEILKDKDYKKYIKEENYKEQKQVDEFALYGHIRKGFERR